MTPDKPHILVVDDDDRLRALLKEYLHGQGFMATAAADSAEARRKMAWFSFDAMVLDVMMPGEDGLTLLESLARAQKIPVLMLSAVADAKDRIRGLRIGAEDYLAKPFDPEELLLRLRAILKRSAHAAPKASTVVFGDYRFDAATAQLTRNGKTVALTSGETALLACLAASAGRPVGRAALAERIPGAASARGIDVQVTRLRRKIGEPEGRPAYLKTVRGKGYVLYAREGA